VEERHSYQGQSGCTAAPAASRGAAPRYHCFRTDAQIARRLQEARSAPYSAGQDRRGRKLVAGRPLVRGGGSDIPRLEAIVCGSVAVTRDGRRCGKGEGYSDLEFAILRELGHPPVPVATTVHDLQVVASVPRDPTDQPLSVIATPTQAIRIKRPSAAPTGIDWTRLSAEDLEEMPILAELKRMTISSA
jgi:5-formyltetrahydrofolate cyclo-ligase